MQIKTFYNILLRIQLVVVFTLLSQSFRAQYFEFRWSDEVKYANNKTGFFSGFIASNSSFIYALNHNYAVSPLNNNNQLMLIAYDKLTMTEMGTVSLKGFPENKPTEALYSTLQYYTTVVSDDHVLVFWTKMIHTDSTKTEELYIESFKTDLKRENTIKKVYTSIQQVDVQQSFFTKPSIIVAAHPESETVVIGSEIHHPGNNVEFRYQILNNKLSTTGEQLLPLASQCPEVQNGLVAGYELGKDGNLYIRTTVSLTRDEQLLLKKHQPRSYQILTILNPVSGKNTSLEFRGEDKTITDFSYVVTDSTAKVLGFFGDLSKDPSGIDKQGIFYADIDSYTLSPVALNYTYFEKTSLNKLFPKSKGGRKKKNVPLTEEELNTRFDIERIFPMEDGSIVLFFTRKYNYAEITSKSGMDGKNQYKTDLYCEKNNVSAIRITKEGKILWTGNIERSITYNGTDIADLQIISRANKFYVMYGIEPKENTTRDKKRGKTATFRDELDYATFDATTGRAKKLELPVNEKNIPKEDKKIVDVSTICVYDNQFYFNNMIIRRKTGWIVANVLCFPTIYYSVLSGNTKCGKGELGALLLLDGKPDRKKR